MKIYQDTEENYKSVGSVILKNVITIKVRSRFSVSVNKH